MIEDRGCVQAKFVDFTIVNKEYHEKHAHYLHSHKDRLELFYITDGEGFYYVDKQEYIVHAGNMVICNAGVTHGESPLRNNKMTSYCCALNGLHIDGLPENNLIDRRENPIVYFNSSVTNHIILAIKGAFSYTGGGTMKYAKCLQQRS